MSIGGTLSSHSEIGSHSFTMISSLQTHACDHSFGTFFNGAWFCGTFSVSQVPLGSQLHSRYCMATLAIWPPLYLVNALCFIMAMQLSFQSSERAPPNALSNGCSPSWLPELLCLCFILAPAQLASSPHPAHRPATHTPSSSQLEALLVKAKEYFTHNLSVPTQQTYSAP